MAYDPKRNYAQEPGAALASGTTAQAAPTQSLTQAAPTQTVTQAAPDLSAASAPQPTPVAHADTAGIRDYLEQARDASVRQVNAQIDRSVTQSVNELSRTREDAYQQYQTQQNQIGLDEARAKDNQALYAAARGDKGGIGAAQYDAIMNNAAQNRVTLNNARTKMATEISRQIAQFRADGESQKADAYFQATQNYMSQLAQIEQWEQEFNVSVDRFNAEMQQAYRNYLFQLRQADIDTERWEREFAANREDAAWKREQARIANNQWQQQFDAGRADAAWNQGFQKEQAQVADNQWRQQFEAGRADTAWNQQYQIRRDNAEDAYRDKLFQYQQTRDAASDEQWQKQFEANRADTAWNQNFQTTQADRAQNQWQREFEASRDDTAWNQRFQTTQADRAQNQWRQEFEASRADAAWNQSFQTTQADRAQNQWQREFDASRADAAWNQSFQTTQADRAQNQWRQEFDASRADAAWNQIYQQGQADFQRQQAQVAQNQWQQQFDANRADAEKQNALARAESMMNVGMTPDAETLKAAGLSREYAQLYISAVKSAQELSSQQAAIELEGKKADALKKIAEAEKASGNASGGDLTALAKAYVQSGATSPKTWLANNYKTFGFTSKPDNDEFEDMVDEIRAKADKGVESDAGPGMRQSVYAGYKRYIETVLGNGAVSAEQRISAVTGRLDAMWKELDAKQRKDLLQFLSGYGLDYVPDGKGA